MSTVTLVTRDAWGNQAREVSFEHGSGVGKEVEAFAEAIEHGEVDPRGSAEQAFLDLRLLESMLESGREGGAVKVVSPM